MAKKPFLRTVPYEKLPEMIEKAQLLAASGMKMQEIAAELKIPMSMAFYYHNGCANDKEYRKVLKRRENYYKERIMERIDKIPLTGYTLKAKKTRKSLYLKVLNKNVTAENIQKDFDGSLKLCVDIICARNIKYKMTSRWTRELRIFPENMKSKAFLKAYGEKVLSRESL